MTDGEKAFGAVAGTVMIFLGALIAADVVTDMENKHADEIAMQARERAKNIAILNQQCKATWPLLSANYERCIEEGKARLETP